MIGVLHIAAAILIIFAVFLLFQTIGGKLCGARVAEIGVFNSPTVFKFSVGGVTFSFNALPLGCYVKFTDDFEFLSPFKKMLVVLAGLLSYAVVAVSILGFAPTVHQIGSGFGQLFAGLFSPIAVGSGYFERLATITTTESFARGVGIAACKFLAFNLLPLGSLSGGVLIVRVLEMFGVRSEKFNEKFALLGLLLLLPFFAAYIVACAAFLWSRLGFN